MKLFIGLLLVATVALTGVLSLPARDPSEDAEVIGYPRGVSTRNEANDNDDDFKDFKGVIDTGSGYPFLQPNPSVLNFGFFDSFDDLFRRFRARLWPVAVLGRGGEDSDEDSGSGGFNIGTNFDTTKGNTTSTVKVVDGHKVEVNETVYGDEHSVFKVRVVNVRPLEEGETVEETVKTSNANSQNPNVKPVTSSPEATSNSDEDDDEEGRREPLAKKSTENEIQGNIDDPEHLTVTENIVETTPITTTATDDNSNSNSKDNDDEDDKMLPTTTEDLAFVTDNGLVAEEGEELSDNGNGNNEFETNMSSVGNSGENAADIAINDDVDVDADDDAIATVAIENNEDTEEVNDNLNESSSTSDVDAQENAANNNEENEFDDIDNKEEVDEDNDDGDDDDDDGALTGEIINTNMRHSNYAVIRNKQREDASSSDDEDADDRTTGEMHSTFNDEWGTYNENIDNKENNDLSNDIDVYDVEPIDLSNDIAVNDAANLPLNPDAEFIDVFGSKQTLHNMPKFEKLSLSVVPDNNEHLSSSSFSGGDMK